MKKIPIIFLIVISFISNFAWISSLSILTSGDWLYQQPATLKELVALPSIWFTTSIGGINIAGSFYPFELMFGLLAKLGFSFGLIERVVFMWPVLIALPVFSYILIKKNVNNTLAAVIGSLIYSYNTYFSEIKTGQLTLLMAYGLAPLVFLFYQKALEKKEIKYVLLAAIFGFIVSFYEFRIFYILCIVLFLYFIYHVLFVEKIKTVGKVIKVCLIAGVTVLIDLLLNLYWLLPLEKVGALSTNAIFSRSLFGNEFLNINYAITLFHPFWTGYLPSAFIVQNIPSYFWLIPIFAFLGLYLNRKNKNVLFFGIITLLGIFLTKQVAIPFTGVYGWLFAHFPGFNAFREASKFYFLVVFGYSVLIAGFVDWVWKNWGTGKLRILGKYILVFVIAVIFLWNVKPFITGEIGTLFVPREIPADYLVVNNFILKQNDYFRTLWLPTNSRWLVYTNDRPEVSMADVLQANWQGYKQYSQITAKEMVNFLHYQYASDLLDMSSIKYVIIPLQDKINADDFFVYYGEPRQYYINDLNQIKYLHKINVGTKNIVVYENENYKPHIYTTSNQESINKEQDYQTVDFKFINPTEYKIRLTNISKPVYLNFSESYHPDWKIRVGHFKWLDALTKKNYFLPDKFHLENDAGLNSFYIDSSQVCKVENGCVRNKGGSYDINLTLYFMPQSYLYLGLIISGGTLIIVLGYLLFIFSSWAGSRFSRGKHV